MKKLILILLCLPMIGFGQEKIDLKSESSIEKYLNSSIIDTIEGIWYFSLNGKTKKIAIIKDTYKYKSTIIDENSDENGFHFLNIIPTYSDNRFILEIFDKIDNQITKIGTTEGQMKDTGLFLFSFKSKTIKILKVYPQKLKK